MYMGNACVICVYAGMFAMNLTVLLF